MAKGHKIYYSMGQVCEMFDLPASTIRFWETRFSVLRPKKNAKGNRLFMTEDIENLKLIYHLTKEKKMTLSGAEKFLMQKRIAAKGEMSLVEMLQKVKATLLEIRQELESTEKQTEGDVIIKSEQVEIEPVVERIVASAQLPNETDQRADTEVAEVSVPEKPRYIELTLF